jgi:DNA-binding phage protein
VNINKFKGKVVERGLNITKLAKKVGMDRSTFYRKMQNDGETFTVREVNSIVNVLGLSAEEALEIFFTNSVACNATEGMREECV